MHRVQGLQILVAGKIGAFHVIEGAEEIGHSLGHMLHVPVGFGARPVILITFPRRIELGILRVEFGVGKFGTRHGRAVGRIERERWRPAETSADEREAGKHVGPDKCAQGGHERALVVAHHHRGTAIAERIDQRDLVAHHVEREKRLGISVPGIVPAGGAAKAATVRGDHIITRGGHGRHHLAPAIGKVRKTMKHQHQRPARRLKACLQDVHRQAIDVRDETRPDSGRKRAVAIGRQAAKIRIRDRRSRRRGGSECQDANTRGRRKKPAPREPQARWCRWSDGPTWRIPCVSDRAIIVFAARQVTNDSCSYREDKLPCSIR